MPTESRLQRFILYSNTSARYIFFICRISFISWAHLLLPAVINVLAGKILDEILCPPLIPLSTYRPVRSVFLFLRCLEEKLT